ncbi:MAG: TonB-dependent receptor domain-containing protein [Silanimonas sp.]
MPFPIRARRSHLALALAAALLSTAPLAQNTTAALGGRIVDEQQSALANAVVTITHQPSGTVTRTVSDANGRYSSRGLRVGGPYRIEVSAGGRAEVREDVFLALAETTRVDLALDAATTLETVVVTAEGNDSAFSPTNIGTTTTLTGEQLRGLASVERNLQDYARLDPRLAQIDRSGGRISVAGQNNRFNSITIDGLNISDTFGLNANNLPTLKQPISIDVIEEVQVNISNYDVTQRGYTGANINAVTKSGTNDLEGSVYYVFRDDSLSGDRFIPASNSYVDPAESEDTTAGFVISGPILRDRLFFLANYEEYQATRIGSTFVPLGGNGNQVFITPAQIDQTREIAQRLYGIDAGNVATVSTVQTDIEEMLLKLDWNITDSHRANLRYNKTEQLTPEFRGFGPTGLSLDSHLFDQQRDIETLTGQWFADWSSAFSTELRLSRREFDQRVQNASRLPQISVEFSGGTPPAGVSGNVRTLRFGTEQFRHVNVLSTVTDEVYFSGNLFLEDHEIKAGFNWSRNDVFNAFLPNSNGTYTFSCLLATDCAQSFEAGRPRTYQVLVPQANRTLDDGIAEWELENLGLFAQDTWTVTDQLTLVLGLRLDLTGMPDSPIGNALVAAAPTGLANVAGRLRSTGGFGLDNANTLDGKRLWQPRLGFNYRFETERPTQLRGGLGLFEGTAANVWLSNPYSNTGSANTVVGCGIAGFPACGTTGPGIFVADPSRQPTQFTGSSGAPAVDVLADGLKQPSVWKANLAFDHELPWWNAVFSAEVLLTEVQDGIYYEHANLGPSTATGRDGRPLFWSPGGLNGACWAADGRPLTTGACAGNAGPISRWLNNPGFSNVLVARPTGKGGGENLTLQISRPRGDDGWAWSLAYNYSDAEEVSSLADSIALGNWSSLDSVNPNAEVATRSDYVIRDRLIGTLSFERAFFGEHATEIGLVYEGRKGRPYSWVYINDLNGDGVGGNDLMYVPRAPGSGDVVFRGGADEEARFWAIANATGLNRYAGGVVERNGDFASWVNSVDLRVRQELPGLFDGHRAELVVDILNVGNLINKRWGRIEELGGLDRSFVNFLGLDAAGRYVYGLGSLEDESIRTGLGESQWAAQVTFRYAF